MRRMLGGMVECAMWHKQWTNTLYSDRFKLLAFLLQWHAQGRGNEQRFVGSNYHALLFMAKYAPMLCPIHHQTPEGVETSDPYDVMVGDCDHTFKFLNLKALQLLKELPAHESELYSSLEEEFSVYLAKEYFSVHSTIAEPEK